MFHTPKNIYGPNLFRMFVDELGGPKKVCKFLDVTERTVWRWLATDSVPRAHVLALYWESKYGRSQVFTEQVNEIRLLYREVCILREQYSRSANIINGLRKLHTGTANEPIFEDMVTFYELPTDTYGASDTSDEHQRIEKVRAHVAKADAEKAALQDMENASAEALNLPQQAHGG